MNRLALFTNQTTNGDGQAKNMELILKGGFIKRTLFVYGDLAGGTFDLLLGVNGQFVVVADATVTSLPAIFNVEFHAEQAKGRLTGCGAGCNVTAILL